MNNSLADFPVGFGHDARLVSFSYSEGRVEFELADSVIRSISIPEIERMWLRDFAEKTVFFDIRALDVDAIETEIPEYRAKYFRAGSSDADCPDADAALTIIKKGGSCIFLESSLGLNGVILSRAPPSQIAVGKAER